ncbi:MarR family winged helix-turn-helix transcriptional regulator [Cellulomonas hominis]
MLQQIHVLLEDGDRRALRPIGLTPTQFTLLRCVDEGDDGSGDGSSITRLAEAMLCTRGNATRLVRRLQEQGLVSTRGDDRDQRLVRVALTDEGHGRLRQARAGLDVAAERRLAHLSPADLETLTRLTEELAQALRRDLDEPAAPAPAV